MRFVILFLGLLGFAMPVPAWAGTEEDLQALRADAMAIPGAVATEFPDFSMVEDSASLAFFYFTNPTHYAYPAAIRRAVVEQDGTVGVGYSMWPYDQLGTALHRSESGWRSLRRWTRRCGKTSLRTADKS